jgi:hypothetical protein
MKMKKDKLSKTGKMKTGRVVVGGGGGKTANLSVTAGW